MINYSGRLAATLLGLLLVPCTWAAPSLTVTGLGPNLSGNLEWLVEAAPDPTLFTNTNQGLGGSLAVELAIEVADNQLLGVTVNNADWPINIAGNNPFTDTVTTGSVVDLANDRVFASLLSDFFVTENAVEVLTLETAGTNCTTLTWGGHTVLDGMADQYDSSLIAQAGQNFTGFQGSLAQADLDGDFDPDCDVDGADFLEWQRHFGSPYTDSDLSDWDTNFGTSAPLLGIFAVPEPSAVALLVLGLLGFVRSRPTRGSVRS